jgi:hypothetical protein
MLNSQNLTNATHLFFFHLLDGTFITQIQLNFILITNALLQTLKDIGFDLLLAYVQSVCTQYEIDVPHINASYKRSFQQQGFVTVY